MTAPAAQPLKLVEIVCRNEKLTVAKVATSRRLDAATIRSGLIEPDLLRAPELKSVLDNRQLFCRHCSGLLWFRAADGNLIAGVPGEAEVA